MNYSLKSRETPCRLLDKIIRVHNTPVNIDKLVLLVEGKYDVPFYEKFCDTKNVCIHFTEGSEKMDSLVPMLIEKGYDYLAIQDSDFKFFGQQKASYSNLFFTDYHDYEMTCFSDTAFSRKFSDRLQQDYGVLIDYSTIDTDLFLLSCYKACNIFYSLGVSFKLIDSKVSELQSIGHTEIQNNLNGNLQQGYVNGFIKGNKNLVDARFHLHNGHDWLERICYQLNGQNCVVEEDLQDLLVYLYTKNTFCKTQLYKDIALWSNESHKDVWN